jgi:hypothetical protein
MRIFTGWDNPFGGGTNQDICKTLVSGTLELGWKSIIKIR